MLIEKNNFNTKKSNEFLKNNKIFPLPLKKVLKYFLTLKTKTKNPIIAMFFMILHKAAFFSINKTMNRKSLKLCVKK